jgi:hypothetical protein
MDQSLLVSLPYIRKPTALIHFERELSVVAQKVMTLIVAHCQKTSKNAQGFYTIEKRQICEFLGWEESHNYPRVVEAFREIFNNTVVWNLFGEDRTFRRLECKLIVSLLDDEVRAMIGFELHHRLEPVIHAPKVFGQVWLKVPALLARSEYAFPFYELLADHISRDEGVLRISLTDLKRYLGLKGRYPIFQMFKTRVLIPSLDSINASTDLQVHYETWKRGQAVGGLIFHIQRQSQPAKSLNAPGKTLTVLAVPPEVARSPEEQTFLERLARHHISDDDAIQALQKHGLAGAMDIFGYVRQEVARRKGTPEEIRNVSAYLARCLREGYGRKGEMERETERAHTAHREQAAAAQQAVQVAHAAHEQAKAETNATLKAQTAEAVERWSALPAAQQAALEQRFLQEEPVWALRPADSMTRLRAFQRWLVQQWL